MIRGLAGTVVWTCLAGIAGTGLFLVKHEVRDLEARLAGLNRDIQAGQQEIHVLNAEWSYLNDPERLRGLAERHLGMHPLAPAQIATLDTLPPPSAAKAAEPVAPPRAAPPQKGRASKQVAKADTGRTPSRPTTGGRRLPPKPNHAPKMAAAPVPHPAAPASPPPSSGRSVAVISSPALAASEATVDTGEAR